MRKHGAAIEEVTNTTQHQAWLLVKYQKTRIRPDTVVSNLQGL